MLGIVDYGMGNRRSMEKAVERVGAEARLTDDHSLLRAADGLIVPGVGAFPAGMRALRERGLDELIRERAAAGVPVFGACLGMQLLFERSEEHGGGERGLGLIPGVIRRLVAKDLKLPHIGWNEVRWLRASPLTEGLPNPTALYHVHSFIAECEDHDDVVGEAEYGEVFPAVVQRGSVFGAQSHPEKSSTHGLALLANFAREVSSRPSAAVAA